MTDHRERRVADASKLLGAIEPYTKVESDARIAAIHNELMFAIDRALDQHGEHRFRQHEIEVLKDISFQIIYVLDAINQPKRGFRKTLWQEFKKASAIEKLKVLAVLVTIGTFIGGVIAGSATVVKPWIDSLATKPIEPAPQAVPTNATSPSVNQSPSRALPNSPNVPPSNIRP